VVTQVGDVPEQCCAVGRGPPQCASGRGLGRGWRHMWARCLNKLGLVVKGHAVHEGGNWPVGHDGLNCWPGSTIPLGRYPLSNYSFQLLQLLQT
jgi:hypothetical protein